LRELMDRPRLWIESSARSTIVQRLGLATRSLALVKANVDNADGVPSYIPILKPTIGHASAPSDSLRNAVPSCDGSLRILTNSDTGIHTFPKGVHMVAWFVI
jgi:hypothetical protein